MILTARLWRARAVMAATVLAGATWLEVLGWPAGASSPVPSPAFVPASVSDGVVTRTLLGPLSDDPLPDGSSWVTTVTSGGPGLVAVGNGERGPVAWLSADGSTWDRVAADEPALDGGTIRAATAWGPGLVAVGSDGAEAAVWTSVDGREWTRVRDSDLAPWADRQSGDSGPYQAILTAVTALADRSLVAGGFVGGAGGYGETATGGTFAASWSRDGIRWRRLHGDTDGLFWAPSSVVAFGNTMSEEDGVIIAAAAWAVPPVPDADLSRPAPVRDPWVEPEILPWASVGAQPADLAGIHVILAGQGGRHD